MSQDALPCPLITGIGLRLPGATGLAAMWSVMAEGRSTVTTVSDRGFDPQFYYDPVPGRRGKSYTFAAGQLENLYHFDPALFSISPREAAEMDPQQRLMLMATWDAVEDAGLDIADLAGPRTGVFVGSSIVDNLTSYYYDTARGGSTFNLGNTLGIIANRVSAQFDFRGPSQVVDTACSSGLTALDMANRALQQDALDVAIVGGVHAIRAPGGFVGFSQARMLSPTGACHAFSAEADGYVRSEAVVVVVLMRPEAADRLSPRVRARLLATGVNTDGGAAPLTVPSGDRQKELIAEVLARADRDPEDLAFYEAHGTGTKVGDPTEASSLGQALATLRRTPLLIGSSKTNFGHSEPAAGLVGLVKSVLALEKRALPASINIRTPNPDIDFEGLNLEVNRTLTALHNGPAVAGVNAFGFGGTNAVAFIEHAQIARADRSTPVSVPSDTQKPWLLLSAASENSLSRLAKNWATRLEDVDASTRAALAAEATRRAELPYRMAVPLDARATKHLNDQMNAASPFIHKGKAALERPRTVYLFSGNGAQTSDMGRLPYALDPVYRARFDEVAQAFADQGVPNLVELARSTEDLGERLFDPLVAQPMLVACQLAQVASLERKGLSPDALIGHSLGELVALHMAGAFDLAALARIVATRSRAFQVIRGQGAMATLSLEPSEVTRLLAGIGRSDLSIAAINGPRNVTVSGPGEAIDRLASASFNGKRLALIRLQVDVPYHSAALDPLESQLREDLADIEFRPLALPVAGPTVGRLLRSREARSDYLWRNTRDTVQFDPAVRALAASGPAHFVEFGPRAILAAAVRDIARHDGLALAHSAATGPDPRTTPDATVARLWASGVRVARAKLAPSEGGARLALPAYPMDLAEYHTALSPDGFDAWGEAGTRRLAGRRPDREVAVWTAEFTPSHPAWLADHRVSGRQVLPAAALIEIALSAACELWPDGAVQLQHFDILRPAEVAGEGLRLRTRIEPETGHLRLETRPRMVECEWALLARGRISLALRVMSHSRRPKLDALKASDTLYDALNARGLEYGPAFRRLARANLGRNGQVVGALEGNAPVDRLILDPTALDAALHGAGLIADQLAKALGTPPDLSRALNEGAALVPLRVGQLVLSKRDAVLSSFRMTRGRVRRRGFDVDLTLFDQDGQPVAQLTGIELGVMQSTHPAIPANRWQSRWVRLRPPSRAVRPPRGWSDPKAALARLGLEAGEGKTPQTEALAPLKKALAEGRDVQPALQHILQDAPQFADVARCLIAAQRQVVLPDVERLSQSNRQDWAVAGTVIDDVLGRWRPQERCRLVLVGLPSVSLVSRLLADPRVDGVTLTHENPAYRDSLMRSLPLSCAALVRAPEEIGPPDFIVSVSNTGVPLGLSPSDKALLVCIDDTGVSANFATGALAENTVSFAALQDRDLLPASLVACLTHDGAERALRLVPYSPDATPVDVLAAALGQIRAIVNDAADEKVTLLYQHPEGGAAFDQISSGLAAAIAAARNEAPAHGLRLIAVAGDTDPDWASVLALGAEEPVVVCKDGLVLAPRLRPMLPELPQGRALRLGQTGAGSHRLSWFADKRRAPKAGEVEISVAATGLNFRDAMLAQGLLPERAVEHGASGGGLGIEVAGHVLRAGPDSALAPGTPVVGFASDAFATHLTLPEHALVPLPEGIAPEVGAGLPVAFVTAWDALVNVAQLRKGETLLVHAGAGAVGLAAIQVARLLGADVISTASSPEKRALVAAAGARAVFDSRGLSFEQETKEATDGSGVDVVLNALSGDAMQASVRCLAVGGRFVELGKRDALEGGQLDLLPFQSGLTYHGYDLDRRLLTHPDVIRESLQTVLDKLVAGDLHPLPVNPLPGEEIAGVIKHMLTGDHIGKLVLRPPVPLVQRAAKTDLPGHWVIVGGSGSLGLALARALISQGAAHVHIVSRGGAPLGLGTPDALWAKGCAALTFHALDARDVAGVKGVLARLTAEVGQLSGVVHAAMIWRDRMLRDLDPVETRIVLDAKLATADAVAHALRDLTTAPQQVLFLSSIAAVLGNPGQAVYAAANAAVEALAVQLNDAGIPAQALALGAVASTDVVSNNRALEERLARLKGLSLLPMTLAIREVLEALRSRRKTSHLFAPVDWERLAPTLPQLSSPMFEAVVPPGACLDTAKGDLAARLNQLDWQAALSLLQAETLAILAKTLRKPLEEIDPHRPFGKYGLDSLMALELRLEIEARLGADLTHLPMTGETTPARFAATLLQQLRSAEAGDDDG